MGQRGGRGGGGADVAAHVGDDWRVIDRKMRRLAARRAALDGEEARLLVVARRMEIHRELGYGSFDEYLERALGYAPTTGRDRIRVAEALENLPQIREAMERGHATFSTVREITRVATAETEGEWLEYIDGLTVREVEQAVRGRRKGDSPNQRPDPDLEPRILRIAVPPHTYALYLEARRHYETQVGHTITDAQLLTVACRAVLCGATSIEPAASQAVLRGAACVGAACVGAASPDADISAEGNGDRAEEPGGRADDPGALDEDAPVAAAATAAAAAAVAPVTTVALSSRTNLPPHQIAIVVCAECKRGWHDAPGRSIELSPAEIERVRCDAVELGRVDLGETPPAATWTIAPRRRRAVLARDRHRCPVPGCTSSTFLDVHHIVHRQHGGDDRMSNLTALCELHHTLHHDGVIRIGGIAGAIVVTHADGRPYGRSPDRPPAARSAPARTE
ncbi:MAG TPA: HNH endonuclease signature motif containing protein [Kofleriaceae bacterium]|nr:HNH endonuclease signature motif containing protein [Kofleriaceae bacterium]